jgi:hypothetical protein
MPQVISHWWGTEAIFSKTEKDELIGAILAVESGVLIIAVISQTSWHPRLLCRWRLRLRRFGGT